MLIEKSRVYFKHVKYSFALNSKISYFCVLMKLATIKSSSWQFEVSAHMAVTVFIRI